MEVLEAYCSTMLDGCKPLSSTSTSSPQGGHTAKNHHTVSRRTTNRSTNVVANTEADTRLSNKPAAAQLQDIKQTLWPKVDVDYATPLQSSKPHIAKRQYNRKKRVKPSVFDIPTVQPLASSAERFVRLEQSLSLEDSPYAFDSAELRDQFAQAKASGYRQYVTAFVCNKGGTGKTTSCINVAAWLARMGKRVLVIDLDAQASATSGMGVTQEVSPYTSADLLGHSIDLDTCIVKTEWGVDIVPASAALVATERTLMLNPSAANTLQRKIAGLHVRYDHIFIDAPAGHGALTINTLVACDDIIMPMDTSSFAESACQILLQMIQQTRMITGKNIDMSSVLLKQTAGNHLDRLSRSDRQRVSEVLSEHQFNATQIINIPFSSACERASRGAMPIADYTPSSSISQAFKKVARRIDTQKMHALNCTDPVSISEFESMNYRNNFEAVVQN